MLICMEKCDFTENIGDIANSNKEIGKNKGFRGIGRLCGLAYCKLLKFTTSYKGENTKSIMTCDAEKMRSMLAENKKYTLDEVWETIVTYSSASEEANKHYFEVEMSQINQENTELLDPQKVRNYLSFVAPVPYNKNFLLRGKIYNHAKELGYKIDEYCILVNGCQIFKEYTSTFNTLYDNEKQIIIASDTSINDYKYLEDRLKTRFRWGLTESINPPELELKKNIIKNKIMINDFDLDINESVIDYIANNCGSDIRNLEGAVIRIVAYKAAFNIKDVTLEIAQEALQEFVPKTVYRTNSVAKIIDIVAKYFNLDASMLKGKMKKKNITDARAIAMYLSRIMTDESLQRIGLEFGGRDHSTVIYSHEKISKELKTNLKLQEEIKILKEKICE